MDMMLDELGEYKKIIAYAGAIDSENITATTLPSEIASMACGMFSIKEKYSQLR
jgi:hypothetical protein